MIDSDRQIPTVIKGPSIAFAILFALSGIYHVYQSIKYKTWIYTWPLLPSSIIFTAGFICREYYAYHLNNTNMVNSWQGLFYSGAIIMSATLYALLSRLLASRPSLSPLKPKYVYGFAQSFLFCILISLTSQGAATYFTKDAKPGTVSSGLALLKASLIMHLALNVAAMMLLGVFYRRCNAVHSFLETGGKSLQAAAGTLFFLATLILVRDVYRIVQIFSPFSSAAWTSEWLFWVFDATMMLLFILVLNVAHPGRILGMNGSLC